MNKFCAILNLREMRFWDAREKKPSVVQFASLASAPIKMASNVRGVNCTGLKCSGAKCPETILVVNNLVAIAILWCTCWNCHLFPFFRFLYCPYLDIANSLGGDYGSLNQIFQRNLLEYHLYCFHNVKQRHICKQSHLYWPNFTIQVDCYWESYYYITVPFKSYGRPKIKLNETLSE